MTAHTLSTAARMIPARDTASRTPLLQLLNVWRQRRALSRLEAHHLADIGLSAREAAREAGRPFWDAPTNWMR